MNEFTKLRDSLNLNSNALDFSEVLLKNTLEMTNNLSKNDQRYIDSFYYLKNIKSLEVINSSQLIEILELIGHNPYIDRYAVDLIISKDKDFSSEKLGQILKEKFDEQVLKKSNVNSLLLYHLIDISLELKVEIMDLNQVEVLLERSDYDLISLLINYIEEFDLNIKKSFYYNLLSKAYPEEIKFQILNMLDNKFTLNGLDMGYIEAQMKTKANQVFYNNFIEFLRKQYYFNNKGCVMLQSMFYGDFEDSGKGNNGGLAILLKTLGNEVSKDKDIGAVATITISEVKNKPFMTYYEDKHLFVRLPAYLNRNITDPFIKRELLIKRYVEGFLNKANIKPDIFHIRYLDNASMSMANYQSP